MNEKKAKELRRIARRVARNDAEAHYLYKEMKKAYRNGWRPDATPGT